MNKDHTGKYFAGSVEEWYHVGPFDTPQEAIEELKNEELLEKEEIYVGKATAVYVELNADMAIDEVANDLYDRLCEDALEDWCVKISQEAKDNLSERLTKVFHEWLLENNQDVCWNVIRPVNPTRSESEDQDE